MLLFLMETLLRYDTKLKIQNEPKNSTVLKIQSFKYSKISSTQKIQVLNF